MVDDGLFTDQANQKPIELQDVELGGLLESKNALDKILNDDNQPG